MNYRLTKKERRKELASEIGHWKEEADKKLMGEKPQDTIFGEAYRLLQEALTLLE